MAFCENCNREITEETTYVYTLEHPKGTASMKTYGTDQYGLPYTSEDVKFLITISVLGAIVFFGALFLVTHKSGECRKACIPTNAPAVEQPVSDSQKDSPEFWADYYRSLWVTKMLLD